MNWSLKRFNKAGTHSLGSVRTNRALASWSAAAFRRFWNADPQTQSGRGLPQSKTWRNVQPPFPRQNYHHCSTVLLFVLGTLLLAGALCQAQAPRETVPPLLNPKSPEVNRTAPKMFKVRFETSKGVIVIEVHRDWSPHGADRFYNLIQAGYYDGDRFFRVIGGRWAQFGINGDPKIASAWRMQTIPDDPRRESNVRGTIAFAFAVPNGRATQVFINLRDNSKTHDPEPFVPFGKVIEGMEVADALNAEYGEEAGSGIRAGKQEPLFHDGNAYLTNHFPHLDYIKHTAVLEPTASNQ